MKGDGIGGGCHEHGTNFGAAKGRGARGGAGGCTPTFVGKRVQNVKMAIDL